MEAPDVPPEKISVDFLLLSFHELGNNLKILPKHKEIAQFNPRNTEIYSLQGWISDLGDEGKSWTNAHTDAEGIRINLCLLF